MNSMVAASKATNHSIVTVARSHPQYRNGSLLRAICSRNYARRAGHIRLRPERKPAQPQGVAQSSCPKDTTLDVAVVLPDGSIASRDIPSASEIDFCISYTSSE
jgi:hypothetical protein